MQEVVKFLTENKDGFLATVEDNKPKVRPFQFMIEDDGKLYFCTNNTKKVYEQIKANPYVEFSSSTPQYAWIRVSGEAKFSNDLRVKEKVIESSGLVKSIYKTADNPIFEIFYFENGIATIADFSGNPPKVVQL